MKKEVLIAIIVGFSLGLIITYGVYRAQRSLTEKAAQDEVAQNTETSLPKNEQGSILSITQPEDGSITDKDSITIGGIAQKNSLVTIISSADEQATQADDLGNFSVDFDLEVGPNQIKVSTFNQDGVKQEKEIYVVYSSYDFESEDDKDES